MESPSRNPLLSREEDSSSEEDESQENVQEIESRKRRNLNIPVDRFNFTYIVFYILGM